MARAHQEVPQAEKPKDLSSSFDLSDSQSQEAPKKRVRAAPPVPIEALRPKRARKHPDVETIKPFVPSEDAVAAAEIYHARQKRKEEADEAKAVAVVEELANEEPTPPTASQQEAMNRESLRAETIELHDRFEDAKAEYEALADAVGRRAKEIGDDLSARNFPPETIMVWMEAIQQREGLSQKLDAAIDKMIATRKEYISRYEAWEQSQRKDETASAEMEKVIDDLVAGNQPDSASFNAQEGAWFKQGEDPEHVKAQAQRQHEEEGQKIEDVRRQIAETYDDRETETVLDTQETIDAAVRETEDMIRRGDLNPDMFDIRDYEYLLTEQMRLDRETEHAGYWARRKIGAELKEIRKDLGGYESQKQSVIDARARARKEPEGLSRKEKEDIKYKGPEPKQALPKGSGTTVHKKSFLSRLFGG